MRVEVCLCFILLLCVASVRGGQPPRPEPQMTFLDNGDVRIGMDLALGGAITHISTKDRSGNIINSADLGRQIAGAVALATGQLSSQSSTAKCPILSLKRPVAACDGCFFP